MQSCIYQGRVSHARIGPVEHRFGNALFMLYLDLDELPELIDKHWALSRSKVAPAAFRREDHFGDPDEFLADSAMGDHEGPYHLAAVPSLLIPDPDPGNRASACSSAWFPECGR